MENAEVNLLAVIIAALFYLFFRWLWFSPSVFGNAYAKIVGKKKYKFDKTKMFGEAILGIIIAAMLALFMNLTQELNGGGGLKIGFLSWLGFSASILLSGVLWDAITVKMLYVIGGFYLVVYLIMGLLIGWIS